MGLRRGCVASPAVLAASGVMAPVCGQERRGGASRGTNQTRTVASPVSSTTLRQPIACEAQASGLGAGTSALAHRVGGRVSFSQEQGGCLPAFCQTPCVLATLCAPFSLRSSHI